MRHLGVVLAFVAVAPIIQSCCNTGIRGSGTGRRETRIVAPFDVISVSGTFTVEITVGPAESVAVTADDNLLSHVTTTVDNKLLTIRTDQPIQPRTDVKLVIQARELKEVRASGANHVTIRGLVGDAFRLDVNGADDVRAEGTCKQLEVVGSGASSIDTRGLTADSVTVRASGAGSYDVFAKSSIDASASGAATIAFYGHPASVRRDATGASHIEER
jgi:Putative auto-transporter adhesin, head GIN domain